jgi:hypothetical protein
MDVLGAAAGRQAVTGPLAYAGHYAHHASGLDWLLDVAVRAVIYGAIGRLMRSLTLPEVLIVAAIVIVAFLAYRRRA